VSIHKRKSGNWEVKYRDLNSRQCSKTFKSKKEAEIFERKVRTDLLQGIWTNPKDSEFTLESVWNDWLGGKQSLKEKTTEDYRSLWEVHIKPHFGNVRLKSLTAKRIQSWAVSAGQDGKSSYRRIKSLKLLSMVLNYATDLQYIPKNPTFGASGKLIVPKSEIEHRRRVGIALTPNELIALSKECGAYEGLVALLGMCGLRWAEAMGLEVKDINLETKRITVSKSLSEVRGKFYESTTKTKNVRVVPISNYLAPLLEPWISNKSENEKVFLNSNGKPISSSNFRNRVFNPAIKALGLPKIRIHDLRHTLASIAASRGASVLAVSRYLGHANPSETLNTYSHLFESDLEKVSESMNEAFFESNVRNLFAITEVSEEATNRKVKKPLQNKTSTEWGGWGSNPGPTDYESVT